MNRLAFDLFLRFFLTAEPVHRLHKCKKHILFLPIPCAFLDWTGMYHMPFLQLRTFALKTSTTQIFFILWLQSDNELPMSEMPKNWGGGGHRLRFRNKVRGKLPQF